MLQKIPGLEVWLSDKRTPSICEDQSSISIPSTGVGGVGRDIHTNKNTSGF
jgi:hypothetical protein